MYSKGAPIISVVISQHGRLKECRKCLDAIQRQTLAADSYEVIVVDDGYTMPDAMVRYYSKGCTRIIQKVHTGVCATRNLGIQNAQGALVAFLDNDCVPSPHWLEELCRAMAHHPNVAGVQGGVLSAKTESLVESYATYRQLLNQPVRSKGAIRTIITANACFRRRILLGIGMFDTTFDRMLHSAGGEDADLSFRILRAGHRVEYWPEAIVYHHHRATLGAFCRQQCRNAHGLSLHASLRGLEMKEFGLPEASVVPMVVHLVRYMAFSNSDSPSLAQRLWHYFRDGDLHCKQRIGFCFLDLVRRMCYLTGIWRSQHTLARFANDEYKRS